MSASEAERAAAELLLQNLFRKVMPPENAKAIYQEALAHFTTAQGNPRWWWEHFRKQLPLTSRQFDDDMAFRRIIELVPEPENEVWFIPEDDEDPYPVYSATPRVIQQILGEGFYYEYLLFDKDRRWLLCETHHSEMIGIGEPVASKLATVS
jgi:hypothetical protein